MPDIKLNFVNKSDEQNNTEIVIVQKNSGIAWTVIENCGRNDNHPFSYPMDLYAEASDSYGNYSPQIVAKPGDVFEMARSASGDILRYKGPGSTEETGIENNLPAGAISACIYKGGKLLAMKTNLEPGQKAAFRFFPTLLIGTASGVKQGEVLNDAVLATINTEFSLMGLASADIVMTGGGDGTHARPVVFTIENAKFV